MKPFLLATPWLVFPLVVLFVLRRRPRLRDYEPWDDHGPRVSIIVPARNEAINIAPCLASLLASGYHNREITVVDDGSRDGTADIVRAFIDQGTHGLRVIEAGPLPDGWVGKCWACWRGYQVARGELLLFTDADTRHQRQLLQRAVTALHQDDAALLSLLPHQLMETFWERVILPHIFLAIALRFRPDRINRSRDPRQVIANGQFLLFRRSCYEQIGGHESVRNEIVEDMALAQQVIKNGKHAMLLHAAESMETRMYRSLRDITEGWTKNLARAAQLSFPVTGKFLLWLAALGLVLWIAPPAIALASLFLPESPGLRTWAVLATSGALIGYLILHLRLGSGIAAAFLYPLGGLLTSWLLLRSGGRGSHVEWRDREYRAPDI